ncbi:MFS transporter, partial [Protofrankia symbiont of Coriaria ruscifolia]|uniref:MFS transporter n=1 Tax=Protofrankia symbiont of Coriaria ruscifolia TaxID=1306542 RepID=UPI003D6D5CAD
MVLTRVVKGLAAALTAPAALSLITTFTEGPRRNRALGAYSLAGATGYSAGLIASGLLTDVSWRLVFFLPAPIALLVVVVAPLALPRDVRPDGSSRGFAGAGAGAVTGGVLLLVFALTERSWQAGIAAVLLLGVFIVIERRQQVPLVPLGVFRSGKLVYC